MDDDGSFNYVQLEDSQEKFLAILPIPSAFLSVLGSSIIVKMAMQSYKKKKWTPYTRLLVAMSLYDIEVSIAFAAATFLRPRDTSTRIWAYGDQATCSTIGFLNMIGFSSFFYNGMLSFYFLLRTKFGFSNERLATKVEPIMHAVAVGYPLLSAVLALSLNMYGELTSGLSCWITDVPLNCGTGEGQSGEFCYSNILAWLSYAIPTIMALVCLCVNSVVLVLFIWKHTRPRQKIEGVTTSSSYFSSSMEIKISESCNGTSLMAKNNSSQMLSATGGRQDSVPSATSSSNSKYADDDDNDDDGDYDDDADSILHEVDKYADTEAEQQRRRMKLLGSQAFLFVACYVMCNIWTSIMLLQESRAQTKREEDAMMVQNYSIAVLQAFFYPLQGFCNCLIYLRPRYLSMRYGLPNESRFSVAKLAVLGEDNLEPNNNDNQVASPRPSTPSTRKGKVARISGANLNIKEDISAEFKQEALDAAHADQDGVSSAIPLPRKLISSLTIGSDEESPPLGKEHDPRWGNPEELMDSKPRKSTNRFQPSLRPSQLEVISELSASLFESVISGPETHSSPIPEPVSPNRSPESRWGTSNGQRPSDLPPTLDLSDRTMRVSNRFSASSQERNFDNSIPDAPATAPSRTPSDLTLDRHPSSEDSSVISEASSVSVDIPIRPPTRKLSPTPSTSS